MKRKSMPAVLRELLTEEGALMAVGAFNAMSAKMVERAGFDAVYVPGGGIALHTIGAADVGLTTMTEMINAAASIVAAVSIPVIADADTGFGNQLNVQRTVREYERVGVSGIHIEDQVFPKRCGHLSGKEVIPMEEAAQKIRAAVDAKSDPDFLVIARCDALAVGGLSEAVRRGNAYLEAGADMLFIEAPRSMEEIQKIPQLLVGAHLFNMSASGKTPTLTVKQVGDLGYKLMIFPNFTTLAAIKSISELLNEIKSSGSVENAKRLCASFDEFANLGDLTEFDAAKSKFAA